MNDQKIEWSDKDCFVLKHTLAKFIEITFPILKKIVFTAQTLQIIQTNLILDIII